MQPPQLLEVKDLYVSFLHKGQTIDAVRGVSFCLLRGETLGIVGESGSGKTTALHAITGLLPKAKITGSAYFEGASLFHSAKNFLGSQIGMVFQDPMTSLNPTMKVRKQIEEGMLFHRLATRQEAKKRAIDLLHQVEIPHPHLRAEQYPHELSGGQRQRVAFAIAMACNPCLLIADEPTTALDTHTKGQVVALFQKFKREREMSSIWISHDLELMEEICDRILIFYQGKIVEEGSAKKILSHPEHPYTQMLIQAKPKGHYSKVGPLGRLSC